MRGLYINATAIGSPTGDGRVGKEELAALSEVSDVKLVLDAQKLRPENYQQPYSVFLQDYFAHTLIKQSGEKFDLCHIYGNPYGVTTYVLQETGCRVIVTFLCHNRKMSIEEHEKWFGEYPFWHVKDDWGFELYTEHVRLADVIVSPSKYNTENIIRDVYGISRDKIVQIPHGCDIPPDVKPFPDKFTVGFLSQAGPDKGIPYLIQAWDQLGYTDSELILAGSGTEKLKPLIETLATHGNFRLLGRVPDPSDVYNNCSVFVLPSINESFGIPVIEAMAHGRPVITTRGCGASDAVEDGVDGFVVSPRNPSEIADYIQFFRENPLDMKKMGENARKKAMDYSWDKIRERYKEVYVKC